MRMRLVRSWLGGGTSAAIMTLVMVACAKGTGSGVIDNGEGVGDAARDVFVIPDDSSVPDGSKSDGAVDAPLDSSPAGTHVVINEIQTDVTELVELYNPTSSTVSLANWEIRYASAGGGAGGAGHKFAASASIAAGAYIVLKPSDSSWTSGMQAVSGQLGLFDGAGAGATLIDAVAYGNVTGGSFREAQSAPSPPSGGSIGRSPNGVDTDDNKADFKTFAATTPGTPNK